ncbi:unnamed protein product [Tuber melanosporum]|uniref:(Perigord truffle) hypothetical protein n=1 Tax=Tuber melanosporum (strain Mel28) TaxID=656061 RepID=D5GJP8_TUBMM|nr:uncharacterized protein GSTUM_00009119001 [Tuber melanosporum]CAZ84741.1 unnamed protein product [Tuber melanosporum]
MTVPASTPLTNFATYIPLNSTQTRVGHLDLESQKITPLSHPSGTPLTNLYEVISAGKNAQFAPTSRFEPPLKLSSVTLLPPISGRDVLAVGKNYAEHAKEFNSSGFDSSDKIDQPTHPVIFTKRATSIVACGSEIFPHAGWTETLDYEGEIGVILGKEGFGIPESEALDYVWGFTIINDVTARERQRDHKQFFLGKSADTFCPMGPVAVPITSLSDYQSLRITTSVNNELRQDSNLSELIFSIPTLVSTISSSQTVQPGDVIATGTPAGVGIGHTPPAYLKPGDVVQVSVSNLGTLTNKIGTPGKRPPPTPQQSPAPPKNFTQLTTLRNRKQVYIERHGDQTSSNVIIFVHGLGANTTFYHPLLSPALCKHNLILYDLEGLGQTPTVASSVTSIPTYVDDLENLMSSLPLPPASKVSLVAHSFGCLIALTYASKHPLQNLILLGPVPIPLKPAPAEAVLRRADKVRAEGMLPLTETIISAAISQKTRMANPLAVTLSRSILRGNDVEGYAKCCTAFAQFTGEGITWDGLRVFGEKVIIAGDEDKSAPLSVVRKTAGRIQARLVVLEEVGHWLVMEDLEGVGRVVEGVFC